MNSFDLMNIMGVLATQNISTRYYDTYEDFMEDVVGNKTKLPVTVIDVAISRTFIEPLIILTHELGNTKKDTLYSHVTVEQFQKLGASFIE